jgi:hypothetical protein
MNWIKSPLAWQAWSGSTLLASLSIHGLVLTLPLAAQKETPKPETLAAIPITALPAEATATSSPKLPEPEQTVKSPPQPDEPSFQESLFDRFPSRNGSSFPERVESFPRQPKEQEEPVEEIEKVEETEEAIEESSNLQSKESEETEKTRIQQESIPDDSSIQNPETPSSPVPNKPRLNPPETPPPAEDIQEKAGQIIQQTSQKIEEELTKALAEAEEKEAEETTEDPDQPRRGLEGGSIVKNSDEIIPWVEGNKSLKDYLFDENNQPRPEKMILIADQDKDFDSQKIYDDFVSPKIFNQNSAVTSQPSQHEGGMMYKVKIDEKLYYAIEIIPIKNWNGEIFGNILAFWNQGSQE